MYQLFDDYPAFNNCELCAITRKANLTGVLAGAVHSSHPGALLTGGGLPQGQVDNIDQRKLLVVPQHISINVIIDSHVLC